jgi:hypothetical protein
MKHGVTPSCKQRFEGRGSFSPRHSPALHLISSALLGGKTTSLGKSGNNIQSSCGFLRRPVPSRNRHSDVPFVRAATKYAVDRVRLSPICTTATFGRKHTSSVPLEYTAVGSPQTLETGVTLLARRVFIDSRVLASNSSREPYNLMSEGCVLAITVSESPESKAFWIASAFSTTAFFSSAERMTVSAPHKNGAHDHIRRKRGRVAFIAATQGTTD